jgi:hypothetical protein
MNLPDEFPRVSISLLRGTSLWYWSWPADPCPFPRLRLFRWLPQ